MSQLKELSEAAYSEKTRWREEYCRLKADRELPGGERRKKNGGKYILEQQIERS